MITGVLLILLSEAILLQSLPIGIWLMVFFIGNAIYFPLVEEKGLAKRFGTSIWIINLMFHDGFPA